MKIPKVVERTDLHKLQEELLACLPSLPNMPDLHRLRDELKSTFPSLSGWHVRELLYNCLPERFFHGNHTDACVLVLHFHLSSMC